MKNLNDLVHEVVAEAEAIGIHPGNIGGVSVNYRAKKRWGQCQLQNGLYFININHLLLEDYVDVEKTKQVIAHEVMHTVAGCFNHGEMWQRVSNKMNREYGYNITRCDSAEELGVKLDRVAQKNKYQVICDKCSHSFYYQRRTKAIVLIENRIPGCTCPYCNSHNFHVIEL